MPQITRPTERVKITLADGIERTLRYSLRAMKEAAEEFGGSITSIDVLKTIDESNLGKLIWYGVRADQPEMTVEQVEDLIDPPMLPYVMQQYRAALTAAVPEAPKNEQSEQPAGPTTTEEPTGSPSGASDDTTSASLTTTSGA